MLGAFKDGGRNGAATMRAGYFGARQTEGIERLAEVVEARGEETLGRVFAENGIAAQRIVNGDMHDVTGVKFKPADRANQTAFARGLD